MNALGRTLPHSLEAEEFLLSCCLLDGTEVISRCQEARIKPESFYDPRHGIVYERLLDLFNRRAPIDVSIVAEELKAARLLDQIGGYAFLTQVSSRIPTTAQAGYFIEKVREQALLREIIRSATGTVEDCYAYTGSMPEFLASIEGRFQAITRPADADGRRREMVLKSLMNFDPRADPDCLMGNRYLCRTGSGIIVAPSGVGKSVLSLQLAICAALGRAFFGLKMVCPLRVLYCQAEDDAGDVAEALQGIAKEYGLTATDMDQLTARLRIVRWNDAAGDKFLHRLRAEYRTFPFDVIIANPLFSFCGCDVSKQSEIGPFLRNGLNPILNDTGAACIFVHHTNKPKEDEKAGKGNEELRYALSGSSEITNWARAVITLQQNKAAGANVYKMGFVKRGNRAGLADDDGNPTTTVLIEHSPLGLCWLPSSYSPSKDASGCYKAKIDIERARRTYVPGLPWARNKAAIAREQNLAPRTVHDYRDDIENGLAAAA